MLVAASGLFCVVIVLLSNLGEAQPSILWMANPVLPNDTALIYGGDFNSTTEVSICTTPTGSAGCTTVATLQSWYFSVKFAIPSIDPLSVYRVVIDGVSGDILLNAAEVSWIHGDAGSQGATPGGFLRYIICYQA